MRKKSPATPKKTKKHSITSNVVKKQSNTSPKTLKDKEAKKNKPLISDIESSGKSAKKKPLKKTSASASIKKKGNIKGEIEKITISKKKEDTKDNKSKAISINKKNKTTHQKISPNSTKTEAVDKSVKEKQDERTIPTFLQSPTPANLKSFRAINRKARKIVVNNKPKKIKGLSFLAKEDKTGKRYAMDFRIHSPATVGYYATGGVDPGPAIVRLAKAKGLEMIAVADYHSAQFIDIVKPAAEKSNIVLLPGFVVRSALGPCKEVFLICLFPEHFTTQSLSRILNKLGVTAKNLGSPDHCLILEFQDILNIIEKAGGLVIPSRVDKNPYRQQAIQYLVEDFGLHTFDLVHPENTDYFRERWPSGEFTFLSFSNANALAQIGSRFSRRRLSGANFEAIKNLVKRRTVA